MTSDVAQQAERTRATLAATETCTWDKPCEGCISTFGERNYAYHYGRLAGAAELLIDVLGESADR